MQAVSVIVHQKTSTSLLEAEFLVCVQVLVDCVKANGTNGCNGGDPTAAYSYIFDHGVPDETCSNYEVLSFTDLCMSSGHA